jgi:predicted ATP-binding protein involved in virulence
MLKQLLIKNFTLIDTLDMKFERGFSVITGETGAGKSIILGAIGLLLEHLINNFEALYEQIIKQGFKAIKQDFKHNFPYLGKDTQIVMQQKTVAGKVFDLDDCGRLLLKTANGTQAVAMGDMDF